MKKYYRIKEFSQLTSVTVRALQLYDNIGLLNPSHKTINKYRLYAEEDILRLQQITTLRFIGFSLEDIKKIISDPNFNLKNSVTTQSTLIAEQAVKLDNVAKLLHKLAKDLENNAAIDWQRLADIIKVMQLHEDNRKNWCETYLSEAEQLEFTKVAQQRSAEYWEKYTKKWLALYQEVENNLHTDPEGKIGMRLARQWLGLVDEIYFNFPNLRKKLWEAYKAGIVPAEGMPYNKALIEYIDKATTKYKKLRVINLNY